MQNRAFSLPVVGSIALSLLLAHCAAAQTAPASSPARDSATTELFPAGDFTFDLTGQYIHEVTNQRREQLSGGSVGGSYYLVDRTAVVVQFPFYSVDQREGSDAFAGGLTLLARYHFLEFDRCTLFIDGGAGALLADNHVPPGGTNFNFTPQVGLGFTYHLMDKLDLIAGARYFHLSNAGIDGGNHNPGINGALQGYGGLMWKF
jgi:hypothetical protein